MLIIRRWGCAAAVAAVVGLAFFPALNGQRSPQGLTVDRVMPRPRLFFAPGEFRRFVGETTSVRAAFFDSLLAEVENRGSRAWNERDLQLESQALVARVLFERRDGRAAKVLELARNSLRHYLDRHTFSEFRDSHDMVTGGSRWLEAVALAYDWAYPHWTPRERSEMADWLRAEIDQWVDGGRIARASPSPFRNDMARGVSGLVAAALAIFDEPGYRPSADKALAHALPLYQEILEAHQYAGADGGLAEGTFYGAMTAWSQVMVAEMLYTGAGHTDAFQRSSFFPARLRYTVHAAWPGYITNQFGFSTHQLAPIFGDARRGPTGSTLRHRSTILLLGKRLPATDAARHAYAVVNRRETSRTYTREWRLYDLLLWSPDVAPQEPTALAYRERTLGQVFARSDWSDGATWMSFNAGPHLDTHQHYDAGNLTIHRNGVDLLVDSGSLDAFGSKHWFNYYARTVAHNTVLVHDPEERWEAIWSGVPDDLAVNDGGQRTQAPLTPAPTLRGYLAARAAYDHAAIERYAAGDWGLYLKSNLTNAYQNPRYQSAKPNRTPNRVKVQYVGREVLYLRRAEGRRDGVVVFDRVVSADPAFRKAVLWHVREPFTTTAQGRRIDEGERLFDASRPTSFQTTSSFRQGDLEGRARLFVTVLPVDPVRIRQIGARPSTGDRVDHETYGTKHFHRHVRDYFVEDPRVSNPDTTTGASNRTEWPPIAPPEVQWLWTDELAGGWGQTRLQVEPARPELADRFLILLVPTDSNDEATPRVELVRGSDARSVGLRWTEGGRQVVILFGSENSGGDLTETSVEIPPALGELLIVGLRPDTGYRVAGSGSRRRIDVATGGTLFSGPQGMLRLDLSSLAPLGAAGDEEASAGALRSGAARSSPPPAAASAPWKGDQIAAGTPSEAGRWRGWIDDRLRDGRLVVQSRWSDPRRPGNVVERLEQRIEGVPVYGGDVVVQRRNEALVSVLGNLSDARVVSGRTAISPADARRAIERAAGIALPRDREPPRLIVPGADATGVRAYCDRVLARHGPRTICVDDDAGQVVLAIDEQRRQARTTEERLPPVYRLDDDESVIAYVNGVAPLAARDRAGPDPGTTAEAVQIHQSAVIAAWNARYGVEDLTGARPVVAIVRSPSGERMIPPMYLGRGVVLYHEGLVSPDQKGRARVAHELAHVLVDRSSRLLAIGESGALEEEFATLMEELTLGARLERGGWLRTAFWQAVDAMPGERTRLEEAVVRALTRLMPSAATASLAQAAIRTAYADLGGSSERLAQAWRGR